MIRKIFVASILLSLLVVGCGSENAMSEEPTMAPTAAPTVEPMPTEAPEPEPLVFTDGLGRTVELDEPATAIVTLGPSILEGLFAIGAGDQVVGREEFSTYPEEALEITNVGSLWGELPSEAIVALEPDLVIAPELIMPEQVAALEDLGLTVFWQANPKDFEGLYANLAELAALSGHADEAQAFGGGKRYCLNQRTADGLLRVGRHRRSEPLHHRRGHLHRHLNHHGRRLEHRRGPGW
jgi:iron complex transport system substrate-binding protein